MSLDAIHVELKNLKSGLSASEKRVMDGQKVLWEKVDDLEKKVGNMDTHFAVEIAKINQAAKTKVAMYGGMMGIGSLLLSVIMYFLS